MLTQQDIDDLKTYLSAYDEFCKGRTCDDSCEVFQRSESLSVSCFKAFCDIQKAAAVVNSMLS